MKAFDYVAPRREEEVLEFLSSRPGVTEILAGGTDLVGLMKKFVVTPDRVVNIEKVESLKQIESDSQGVTVGAVVTLARLREHPALAEFPAIRQAIDGIASDQFRSQGTLGGELCQRPQCWYFRNGHGLLAERGRMVTQGRNEFHAIFGNSGPAKFVCPSRLAPALIALDAQVRIAGPKPGDESILPLEMLYRVPRDEREREHVLEPNQFVTHVTIPRAADRLNASYEVRHGEGPDYPLASASASIMMEEGRVVDAKIVLGQVAPTPWISHEAARALIGKQMDERTAGTAGDAAVSVAAPLSQNGYKVQLARVCVKRAILRAAGMPTGGFE
jgi:xanthine dehydrogenase YagS FAD-binding subunit